MEGAVAQVPVREPMPSQTCPALAKAPPCPPRYVLPTHAVGAWCPPWVEAV